MPSYRVVLTVGLLRPGVAAADVLPAAAAAARARTTVEAYDVGVVHGRPRLTVRYTSDDDALGLGGGGVGRATAATLVDVLDSAITRRYGNRWYEVRDR